MDYLILVLSIHLFPFYLLVLGLEYEMFSLPLILELHMEGFLVCLSYVSLPE